MSSVHYSQLLPFTFLLILLLTCLSFDATTAQTTMSDCGPNLLSLMPCAPFVQGSSSMPVQACCDGFKQLYDQKPTCLCLLLNDTAFSSFPINTTLALELPHLCNLQVDPSLCPGPPGTTSLPSVPPTTQVSFGATPQNPTVAASPVITVQPRPSIMGFPLRSGEDKLKAGCQLPMLLVSAILTVLTGITC